MAVEKTLVILKPDAVRRKITGEIITRFEKKGYDIARLKKTTISKETAEEHYEHVKKMPFFADMIEYITSGPVLIMIIEGESAIKIVRSMIGKTSSLESAPGTIRGDYSCHPYENLIHASDSNESAEVEIKRFFTEPW